MTRRSQLTRFFSNWKPIASAFAFIAFGHLSTKINPLLIKSSQENASEPSIVCTEIVQLEATISGEQIGKLSEIATFSKREKVEAILQKPYCYLSPLSIRKDVITEREAYPLVDKNNTYLIVLYEENNYVGYGLQRF